ncbi:MAG: DUF4243 domain-containing protein [Chloroflexi bacterium]|nr:DUF4243 domain-containing protein [Chloroflexota bacterium]
MAADILDELLERFAATGPEFNGGLSNHGPMAAEALVALGRADAAAAWSEWYAERLVEHPAARNPIDASNWREALGDVGRAGDWIAFFDRELREHSWQEVLDAWVARLGPGIMAGATHGILRTGHAVRTLAAGENASRLRELAEGLGYWAARYQLLPGAVHDPGARRVADALASVPRIDPSHRRGGLIFEAVKTVAEVDFEPVINYVTTSDDGDFVSDLTRTFVRQYLANAGHAFIPFIHSVTAPSMLRILAPHLSDATRDAAMRYAWQACASIYSTYSNAEPALVPTLTAAADFDEADLTDRAVATRDEHGIKFTEACLREYHVTGDAAFVAAAQDIVVRLRR